jgi:hypothetical protein
LRSAAWRAEQVARSRKVKAADARRGALPGRRSKVCRILPGVRTVDAKELNDIIAAALAPAQRDRGSFIAVCLVALVILVGFVVIVFIGQ